MSKTKIELNVNGLHKLMKSDDMMDAMQAQANKILARLGDGYESDQYVGKTRVNVSVGAATKAAYFDNLKNNTLLKALK